jgi:hypothetical protein
MRLLGSAHKPQQISFTTLRARGCESIGRMEECIAADRACADACQNAAQFFITGEKLVPLNCRPLVACDNYVIKFIR